MVDSRIFNPVFGAGLIAEDNSNDFRQYLKDGNLPSGRGRPFVPKRITNAYGDALTNKGRIELNKRNEKSFNEQPEYITDQRGPEDTFRNSKMFIPSGTTVNQNSLLQSENTNSPFGQDAAVLLGNTAEVVSAGANAFNKYVVGPVQSYFTGGENPYKNLDTSITTMGYNTDISAAETKDGTKSFSGTGGYVNQFSDWINTTIDNQGKNTLRGMEVGFNQGQVDRGLAKGAIDKFNNELAVKAQEKFDDDVAKGTIDNTVNQSDITKVIAETSKLTDSSGEVTSASTVLTTALTTKDDTKVDKITGAINGFMDKLDTPGFQTALAMHMEAKNGGDVTSVLFEGMKVKKKAKLDAMTAHKNNLIVKKAEFEIIDLINKAGKPEPASKNLTALATSFLTSGKYDLRSADQGTAIVTLTDYAKKLQTVNNRLTESEAFMEAVRIADRAGALTEDAFLDNPFNGFGGEFDATVTLPTPSSKSINLSALQTQADAQGISIIDAAEQARIAGYVIDQSK